MNQLNLIALEESKAKEISAELNNLLSTYQVYYQNLRGFHWNIKGRNFFELHLKFEELYNNAAMFIDELAERILALNDTPLHSFDDYLENSKIESKKNISNDEEAIEAVINDLSVIVKLLRNALSLASGADDETSLSILSDELRAQEKNIWMLNSWFKN